MRVRTVLWGLSNFYRGSFYCTPGLKLYSKGYCCKSGLFTAIDECSRFSFVQVVTGIENKHLTWEFHLYKVSPKFKIKPAFNCKGFPLPIGYILNVPGSPIMDYYKIKRTKRTFISVWYEDKHLLLIHCTCLNTNSSCCDLHALWFAVHYLCTSQFPSTSSSAWSVFLCVQSLWVR